MQLFALCGKSLQVDGSLGMTAAITEMLMQSQDAAINLLPALPDEWPSGEFRGVRARGGFELDLKWDNKRITRLKVTSKAGGTFRMRSDAEMDITVNGVKRSVAANNGILEFPTTKGVEYLLALK
jgi:alpha-L-fucosidase 2